MTIEEKYLDQLNAVRQNKNLLADYSFNEDENYSRHIARLRLNIAIFNNFKETDYEIVKFLFEEETKWRKLDDLDGEVDNLYFSALLLSMFSKPENVWLFFENKNIDFDSGIGFDGEYLVSAGISETYKCLETAEHPFKTKLLEYIGETEESCCYLQEDIDNWKESKKSYFRTYTYPIEDELWFLFSMNERELFLPKLPEWIKQKRKWTQDELTSYCAFAKYSGNKALEIESVKLIIEKGDKDFLDDSYKRQLAGLYIDVADFTKAFEIIKDSINKTDNANVVRDCVELLCKIIIKTNNSEDKTSKNAYKIISAQQQKYKNFSPNADDLIKEALKIMKVETSTQQNNSLPTSERPWWKKLFGS